MREILFRGKRADNEKWEFGLLSRQRDLDGRDEFYIQTLRRSEYGFGGIAVSIIPSTIGQYTGLTDKNGIKIFEWDIVEYKGERYVIKYLEKHARFVPTKPNTVFAVFSYANAEVIGNVHDNPELLGDKENG